MFETILDSEARWLVGDAVSLVAKSVILLAGAGAVVFLLRRAPAATRHLVWTLALAGLLALPVLERGMPHWTWPILPARHETGLVPSLVPPSDALSLPEPIAPGRMFEGAQARPALASATDNRSTEGERTAGLQWPPDSPSAPGSATLTGSSAQSFASWLMLAWLAGLAGTLVVPLAGWLGRRQLALGAKPVGTAEWTRLLPKQGAWLRLSRSVTFLCSDRAVMPMTWGWLRPVVLLPAGAATWPLERLRDVLMHELAHVRRFDCLTQAIAQAACALYWFNPLAWLAARRMRIERERACDDLVLRAGTRPSDYAGHLLEIARDLREGRTAALAAVAMARPSQLEGRLLAILDPARRRGGLGRTSAVLALAGVIGGLVSLSAVRLKARAVQDVPGAAAPRTSEQDDGSVRMVVTGRVLDPDGKPLAGVPVDLVGRLRTVWVSRSLSDRHVLLGRGATDADGRFRIKAARTSAQAFFEVHALASSPGFGIGWALLNPAAEQPAADVRLRPEQPVVGKLIDLNGQAAANVNVAVQHIGHSTNLGTFDGVSMWDHPPDGLRTWPIVVPTDNEGRFSIAGIPRDQSVALRVEDPRFGVQTFVIDSKAALGQKEFKQALQPATIVEGRVLRADTGEPIADAAVYVASSRQRFIGSHGSRFQTDEQGRYRANVEPGQYYSVTAYPPPGQPYLVSRQEFEWTKGALRRHFDVKVPRGALLRGKVTEEGTNRPLAGASIQYFGKSRSDEVVQGWQAIEASGTSGSFQIAVLPGRGHLLLFGPTSDYVLKEIGSGMLYGNKPGGERNYAHGVVAYEAKAGEVIEDMKASLRPGKTVRGRVVGPNGETVEDAAIITTLHIEHFNPSWRGDFQLHARDGRFALHGLDPEKAETVYFLDPDHMWGATVQLSGKQAGDDIQVTLEPCGTARATFIGHDGKPIPNLFPHFEILAKPGPPQFARSTSGKGEMAADAAYMPNVDRKHYWNGPKTDADGRITLPDLIPGALYRITDFSTVNNQDKGVQVRKEFTVKPGETIDLGDVLIEKPPV